MLFRSTNSKFTHHQGDFLSNTDDGSSHGIHLTGGSTGGVVQPCGDEADIALRLAPKGSGPLILGTAGGGPISLLSSGALTLTSTTVNLTSTTVNVGTSGAVVTVAGGSPFSGFIKFTDTAVGTPNFATTNAMVMETTHVITGVTALTAGSTAGYFVLANGHNLSTDCALVGAYVGSTAGDVHCRFLKASTLSVGASTATISFLIVRT